MNVQRCFPLILLIPTALAKQTVAHYFDLPPDAQSQVLAVDASGNFFVAATFKDASGRNLARVLKTDQNGQTLASTELDLLTVQAATALNNGHLVVAGTPSSANFPLISPVMPNAGPHSDVIVEMAADLSGILFSTRIGGSTGYGPGHGGTLIGGVSADSAGNLYVTGTTSDTDFPVTTAAFQSTPPTGDIFGTAAFAYLTEITADRRRLGFSTYFGDSAVTCMGGSHCIGVFGNTEGAAVAVGATGDITIGGSTTAIHLPVTPGAYASQCACTSDSASGFAGRFAPSGALQWATYLPLGHGGERSYGPVSAMALNSGANVLLAGSAQTGFPTTLGALQPELPGGGFVSGFVAKLDAAGRALLSATFMGGNSSSTIAEVHRVAVGQDDSVWMTGISDPALLPHTGPGFGTTYVGSLSPTLSAADTLFTVPAGAAGQALVITPDDTVAVLGSANSLLLTTARTGPSLFGFANAAASQVSNVVAPFELISLYGIGLGPAIPVGAEIVGGVVTSQLGGVQVMFDGIPAPLLYAGPNQVNAVVPQEVYGHATTSIQIDTPQGVLEGPIMSVRQVQPAIFLANAANGFAAALNEDGSVNSAANPAAPGSVVSVWGTGAGITSYPKVDGQVVTENPGPIAFPVAVIAGNAANAGRSLEVLYAGDAPGLVAGVVQINFRLPGNVSEIGGRFQVQVGEELSPSFTVYVR